MNKDIQIKCGNISSGVYLYEDIKERLNARHLTGSMGYIQDIHDDGETWITITVYFHRDPGSGLATNHLLYIQGMVAGILLWSGVEVI